MSSAKPSFVVRAADREEKGPFQHPHNPNCEMFGASLGDIVGLQGIGVHIVRVPAGKEAAAYHTHTVENEFYFILSGRAVVEIDGEEQTVGPGDFVGLPAPSPAHQLRNPFEQDLVYLVGGERKPFEFAELPRAGRHVIRVAGEAWAVASEHLEPFWRADKD
jgi:uncharacterized cupin superfamily protein